MRLSFRRGLAYAAVAIGALTLSGVGIGTAQASTSHVVDAHHSRPAPAKPTVVLVHGAWADASSWSGEVSRLQHDGYPVVVAPNPLRGLSSDADYLRSFLGGITGPVILVGHSYGGAVITNAATGNANVKALVYVDAYIPDADQSVAELTSADSVLAPAGTNPASVFKLLPYPGAPAGIYDTYLLPDVFAAALGGGLSKSQIAVLAASQSPTSLVALGEHSGAPAWASIPSWALIGTQDKLITPATQLSMATHAKAHVVKVDAGHLSLVTAPDAVTKLIETAARATA
ncbi:alpha/beta fold hydrolase [Catellatospora citrea]|uniref:Alpha/beta hydrolase n=1 Tax=Catellatospora citrea TaxID=53366 RepID=A0A8J3KN66_9ACTN|nr:alpha/beta hydrolase [Catellatospora citrea]RKE05454.1 pimeloyl-ACP methyl ester carboxylesterase [Catellatospora citrea]GIG00126.1 alpha/beta hydrolase [Catellatospora citrea]